MTSEEAGDGIKKIRDEFRLRGRDPSDIAVSHEMFTSIDQNGEQASLSAAKSLSTNFVSVEEGLKRSLVGSPKELTKRLEEYLSAGVEVYGVKICLFRHFLATKYDESFRERSNLIVSLDVSK